MGALVFVLLRSDVRTACAAVQDHADIHTRRFFLRGKTCQLRRCSACCPLRRYPDTQELALCPSSSRDRDRRHAARRPCASASVVDPAGPCRRCDDLRSRNQMRAAAAPDADVAGCPSTCLAWRARVRTARLRRIFRTTCGATEQAVPTVRRAYSWDHPQQLTSLRIAMQCSCDMSPMPLRQIWALPWLTSLARLLAAPAGEPAPQP